MRRIKREGAMPLAREASHYLQGYCSLLFNVPLNGCTWGEKEGDAERYQVQRRFSDFLCENVQEKESG